MQKPNHTQPVSGAKRAVAKRQRPIRRSVAYPIKGGERPTYVNQPHAKNAFMRPLSSNLGIASAMITTNMPLVIPPV